MPLPQLRCKRGVEVIPAICVRAVAAPQFATVGTLVWVHCPGLEPGHLASASSAYLMAKSFHGLKITFASLKHHLSPYGPSVVT